VLSVEGVRKRFGGIWALDGVSLSIPGGRVVGLIGPNGSGKTTLLNTINGVYVPDEGQIRLDGRVVSGRPPHHLARLGVARTFQAARVFSTLTVRENMLLPTVPMRRDSAEAEQQALELLDGVNLRPFWDRPASELSGGQQKLLEFARMQMSEPKLLLMDEPFAGVHPEIVRLMTERVTDVSNRGTAVLVVSHEIPVLMQLAREVVCMSAGRVIAAGSPGQVEQDPGVLEAYLGTGRTTGEREAPPDA